MGSLDYKPDGQVLKNFLKDNSFFRGLRGPVGSGKSVAVGLEKLLERALIKPSEDGKENQDGL